MRLVALIVFCGLLLKKIDGIGSFGGLKNETRGFNKTGGKFISNFFRFSGNYDYRYASKYINLISCRLEKRYTYFQRYLHEEKNRKTINNYYHSRVYPHRKRHCE